MNIVLIGYRGSGKTTIGKLLANELWKTFVDVDAQICRRFGDDSIANIWATHGEQAFRKMEVEVTRELCAKQGQVIALGGGTLMQPEARQAIEDAADMVRVYLHCSPVVLHKRIAADVESAKTRPNLTAHGGGLEEIKAVLAVREPVYREVADKELDVTDLDPKAAVRFLISRCL